MKEDPVRLELSLTPAYGKDPITVGLVESLDLVARRDREGRIPRDLQGTWDWTVRHGQVSTGGWNPLSQGSPADHVRNRSPGHRV